MIRVKRKARVSLYFVCALFICALLVNCANNKTPDASGGQAPTSETPQRIISLSPSTTEILYGVGAFERVVAVSDYCDYPAEVKNLPRVGGWGNPNIERLAALRPDLVIVSDVQLPFLKSRLDALHIPVLGVPSKSLTDALDAITLVGRATKQEARAGTLRVETEARISSVRARTRDLPKPRVLCIVDRVPGTLRDLYSISRESFLAELIQAAGGEVLSVPNAPGGYGQISKEAVLQMNPDIIIDMVQGASKSADNNNNGGALDEDLQKVWRELSQLKAVRDGRVHQLRDTSVLHPSQFVADTAERFARLLHPEVFREK